MLAAGVIISALMNLTRTDNAYSLVLVWAYIGIAVKQAGSPLVANAAWIAAGLILVILVAGVVRKRKRRSYLFGC